MIHRLMISSKINRNVEDFIQKNVIAARENLLHLKIVRAEKLQVHSTATLQHKHKLKLNVSPKTIQHRLHELGFSSVFQIKECICK